MTLHRPMLPPMAEKIPHAKIFAAPTVVESLPPRAKPAQIGRRGLLGAFLALVPTAAVAGAVGSLPAPDAPELRENRRLLWLGQQLDQAEAEFASALDHKARCRERAQMAFPEPAAAITWLPGEHPPAWCGTRDETDVDGHVVYWKGNPRHFRTTARQIAAADLLRDYIENADRRTRAWREARQLLPIAQAYEDAIERVDEETGYGRAYREVSKLARRIERIATLIYKCECRTFEGVAIKALALMIAVKADEVEDYIAHRSKVLYATMLADDVLALRKAAASPGGCAPRSPSSKGGRHA